MTHYALADSLGYPKIKGLLTAQEKKWARRAGYTAHWQDSTYVARDGCLYRKPFNGSGLDGLGYSLTKFRKMIQPETQTETVASAA